MWKISGGNVRGNRPGSGGSSGNGDMRCVIGLRCPDAMRTAEVWEPLCLGVNRLDLRNVWLIAEDTLRCEQHSYRKEEL